MGGQQNAWIDLDELIEYKDLTKIDSELRVKRLNFDFYDLFDF
jgi:hypothetical protein